MNTLEKLFQQGQSIWCDNLSRAMIAGGELRRLIERGVVGVTSNPTIFMKSITGSSDYDSLFMQHLDTGKDLLGVYEELVVPDICDAADLLRPVYDRTGGIDGFVSLEVNPKLAYQTQGTIEEARRLFRRVNRPNVFIKVPATDEGIPAIERLIGEGISVNVTLIFSIAMYRKVMQAYIGGLAALQKRGGDLSKVASVASFFVSRVDTLVDKKLEAMRAAGKPVDALFGKAAIANAKMAYVRFQETFDPAGAFGALAAAGARVQRPLWASTSTKNPNYRDTIYVDELVGPETVNTLPPVTIEAVIDHGRTAITIDQDLDGARRSLVQLADFGIDMQDVTDELTADGVKLFAQSFDELLANLKQKQSQLRPVG